MKIKKFALALVIVIVFTILGVLFIARVAPGPVNQLALVTQTIVSSFTSNRTDVSLSTPPEPVVANYCTGNGDDRDYLYSLNTNIFTKTDGTKSFTSFRMPDNKLLRQVFSDEHFYTDKSNGTLQISYDIVAKCGGVDVVYTLRNPTNQPQNAPDLRIDGITQRTSGDFYVLDTQDSGYLRNVKKSNDAVTNIFLGSAGGENLQNQGVLSYPGFYYSPVLVADDTDFTAGSALLYPYLQYKHEIVPQLTKITTGAQAGTWRHEYREFSPAQFAQLAAGEQRTYTVTLRFTDARAWILTLDPYKKFFKQTYGSVDQTKPEDRRPVFGIDPEYFAYLSPENPRSYKPFSYMQSLSAGDWGPFITGYINEVTTHGFQRTMIWAASGAYASNVPCLVQSAGTQNIPGLQNCNYAPAFMDFTPGLTSTAGQFSRFAQNNLNLGFWWGRSGQVPVPNQWNPPIVVDADYSNPSHISFLNGELALAVQRGAKTIGLDAFLGPAYQRYVRIDELKRLTNNQVLFIHEGPGADILHRKIANFSDSTHYAWWTQFDKNTLDGPDVLSRYLNAGSEIWLQYEQPFGCTMTGLQQAISWGFVPVDYGGCGADVHNISLARVACYDGIDNDNNGKTDWPYDSGCSGPTDTTEAGGSSAQNPNQFFAGLTIPDNGGGSPPPGTDPNLPGSPGSRGVTVGGSVAFQDLLKQIQQLFALVANLQNLIQIRNGGSGYAPSTPTTPRSPAPSSPSAPGRTSPSAPRGPTISPGMNYVFHKDLSVGSTGNDVTVLQNFLVSKGFLIMPADAVYGEFGELTAAALTRFQIAAGIVPANGNFGPETRDRVNNLFSGH